MRRLIFVVLVSLLLAGAVHAQQCVVQVQLQPDNSIDLSWCADQPNLKTGDVITIEPGGLTINATVVSVKGNAAVGILVDTNATLTDEAKVALENDGAVTLKAGDKTITGKIQSNILKAKNYNKSDWSFGPATKGDEDGGGDDDDEDGGGAAALADDEPAADEGDEDTIGALRFRYAGEYARGGFLGKDPTKGKLLQTTATLNIDTTDQEDPDFIDNNRVAVGVQTTGLSLGRLFMHGNAGIEARVEKGFHSPNRNADLVAKVSGWVPVARSITLFPRNGVFIAAPLSFTASYGYRNKSQDDVDSQGRVFEATALYHLFLMDQFQIDLSAVLTHSDLDDLPAGTPKTQRMYKATISYMQDPSKGFKVLTSIENGSFGVMLKDVRQYFVGVALSKLDFTK